MRRPVPSAPRPILDTSVSKAGQYHLIARYEYPFRDYHVRMAVTVEQPDQPLARLEIGAPGATRAGSSASMTRRGTTIPHGVEGLVTEGATLDLVAGPAPFTLEVLDGSEPAADRNLDLLLLTTDTDETYRTRGTRAYPILDEIGLATAGRVFMRVTNPADSGESSERRSTVHHQSGAVDVARPGDRQDRHQPIERAAAAPGAGRAHALVRYLLPRHHATRLISRSTRSTTARIGGRRCWWNWPSAAERQRHPQDD